MEPEHEHNTARLIHAALGPDARPSPDARARVLARLRAEAHRLQPASFPASALALLVAALAVMGAWSVLQGAGSPLLAIAAIVPAVNLVMVPVASAVILVRRRHV